jgi:hypothetical protein
MRQLRQESNAITAAAADATKAIASKESDAVTAAAES